MWSIILFQRYLKVCWVAFFARCIRHVHEHTKLAIMALVPTLYSHTYTCSFLCYCELKMLANVKLYVSGLHFKAADFIGLFNFEWHSQSEVGNIAILVLRRDREKL